MLRVRFRSSQMMFLSSQLSAIRIGVGRIQELAARQYELRKGVRVEGRRLGQFSGVPSNFPGVSSQQGSGGARKGEHQDIRRLDLVVFAEPDDPRCQRPGLSRSRRD